MTPDFGGQRAEISRRTLLKTGAGSLLLTVLAIPDIAIPATHELQELAGQAKRRIDGLAKVTGQKVYARDFNARDMAGWPSQQKFAMFMRATTTEHAFRELDLSDLRKDELPERIVYGDQMHKTQRAPLIMGRRDLLLDSRDDFDQPKGMLYDLVVKRGHAPDFLGQAVALLIFASKPAYDSARKKMQFRDSDFQVYDSAPAPQPDAVTYSPTTRFVRYDADGQAFSYAQNPDDYDELEPVFADAIDLYLDENPQLIRHDYTSDMRTMDPMFMEPESGIAWYERDNRNLHLVLGTQSPDGDVLGISQMYGSTDSPLPLSNITLTPCYPGGGFGGRDSSPFSLMLALAAAYGDGAPVRLSYDRFEQFRVGLKRHACALSGMLAVDADQKIRVNKMQLEFDGGGRKNLSPYVAQLAALCSSGAYDVPMADVAAKAVHSINIPGGSQRGFGGPQAYFAIETALDDIAAQMGWDPIALRLNNIVDQGDRTVSGGAINQSLRLKEMLQHAQTNPVWADRAAIKADYAARGLTYGTGLAMSMQAYGTSGDGVVAAVSMDRDGVIRVASDAVDMGNGSATTLSVVVGPYLGRNADSIEMGGYTLFTQTGLSDEKGGSWSDPGWTAKGVGSSSACLTALHQVHVVQQAARALFLLAILPQAAEIWGLDSLEEDQTKWVDGQLTYLPGGKPPLPQADLAEANFTRGGTSSVLAHGFYQGSWTSADFPINGTLTRLELDGLAVTSALGFGPTPVRRRNTVAPAGNPRDGRYVWAPAVNLIGLTVDKTSGRVQIENAVTVLNAGKVHVPELVSGQAQGGLAMAIGYTLSEDLPPGMDGPASGNWNLNRYHVPHFADVPLNQSYSAGRRSQQLVLLPADGETTGRGIAESVMVSVAPAISNALRDALGVRFQSLPITPAKIKAEINP